MEPSGLDKNELEKVMSETTCRVDFACYKQDFKRICKVDIVTDDVLFCQDNPAEHCEYGLSFGNGFICQCPLRQYAARTLHR